MSVKKKSKFKYFCKGLVRRLASPYPSLIITSLIISFWGCRTNSERCHTNSYKLYTN